MQVQFVFGADPLEGIWSQTASVWTDLWNYLDRQKLQECANYDLHTHVAPIWHRVFRSFRGILESDADRLDHFWRNPILTRWRRTETRWDVIIFRSWRRRFIRYTVCMWRIETSHKRNVVHQKLTNANLRKPQCSSAYLLGFDIAVASHTWRTWIICARVFCQAAGQSRWIFAQPSFQVIGRETQYGLCGVWFWCHLADITVWQNSNFRMETIAFIPHGKRMGKSAKLNALLVIPAHLILSATSTRSCAKQEKDKLWWWWSLLATIHNCAVFCQLSWLRAHLLRTQTWQFG